MIQDFFYLLVKLTLDDRVPAIDKAKFAGTLAYTAGFNIVLHVSFVGKLNDVLV